MKIYILPAYRRIGYATAFVKAAENILRTEGNQTVAHMYVKPTNALALRAWQSLGYTRVVGGADAGGSIRLEKSLGGGGSTRLPSGPFRVESLI